MTFIASMCHVATCACQLANSMCHLKMQMCECTCIHVGVYVHNAHSHTIYTCIETFDTHTHTRTHSLMHYSFQSLPGESATSWQRCRGSREVLPGTCELIMHFHVVDAVYVHVHVHTCICIHVYAIVSVHVLLMCMPHVTLTLAIFLLRTLIKLVT